MYGLPEHYGRTEVPDAKPEQPWFYCDLSPAVFEQLKSDDLLAELKAAEKLKVDLTEAEKDANYFAKNGPTEEKEDWAKLAKLYGNLVKKLTEAIESGAVMNMDFIKFGNGTEPIALQRGGANGPYLDVNASIYLQYRNQASKALLWAHLHHETSHLSYALDRPADQHYGRAGTEEFAVRMEFRSYSSNRARWNSGGMTFGPREQLLQQCTSLIDAKNYQVAVETYLSYQHRYDWKPWDQ